MEEIQMADNEVEVVEQPTEEVVEQQEQQEEFAEPQKEVTETQAFSKRLKEMSNRAVDDFVKGLNVTNEVTGKPITTRKEYEIYQKQLQAQDKGLDPVLTAENDELRMELAHYKRADQVNEIMRDPTMKDLYESHKAEVDEILALADADPNGHNVDVRSALASVLLNQPQKFINEIKEKASTETMKQVQAKAKASPGKLGGGDVPKSVDFSSMTDEEFENYHRQAMRGDLKGNSIFG